MQNSSRGLSRRQFLHRAGLAVGTLAAQRGGAQQSARPILGTGSHRYECINDWLMPPDNIKWGDTHGVCQDSHGRIYVAHTVHPDSPSGDAVVVFDRHGKFLTSWGSRYRGGGHGLDIRREGHTEYLYHCDIAHRLVVKTTLDGEVLWEKGLPQESGVYKPGDPFVPTNVALAHNGDFYVADGYGSNWIHQYNLKGDYIRTFGGTGTEPGKMRTPHGIWVDTRGSEPALVVADRSNHRLQYFTMDGKYMRSVTNGMRAPVHFDIRGGDLLVPDLDSVVTILDSDNRVAAQIGDGFPSNLRDAPRSQWIPGKFIHPHAAKYLHNGDIVVVEWVPIGRVSLLRKLA